MTLFWSVQSTATSESRRSSSSVSLRLGRTKKSFAIRAAQARDEIFGITVFTRPKFKSLNIFWKT